MEQAKQYFQSAVENYKIGKLDESEFFCKKVLEFNPTFGDVYNMLGLIQQQKKDNKLAVEYFRKALQCDKQNVVYLNNLANNLTAIHKDEEAIKTIIKAIGLNSNFYNSYFNLGKIYRKVDNNEEAENCFLKTLSLKPDYVPALNNLANIYQSKGKTLEALELFEKAVTINPALPVLHANIGSIYQILNDFQKSLISFNKAIQLDPSYLLAYIGAANSHMNSFNFSEAEKYYAQIIKLDPINKDAWLNLGKIQNKLGDTAKAIAYYEKAKSIDPKNSDAIINLAVIYLMLSENEKAEKYFIEAIELNPENKEALFGLGKIAELGKDYAQAKTYLEKCLALSPNYKIQVIYEFMMMKLRCADWTDYDSLCERLKLETQEYIENSNLQFSLTPLTLNYLDIPMEIHTSVASKYAEIITAEMSEAKKNTDFKFPKTLHNGKLRIGYISPDFRLHAVGLLLNKLFSFHNKSAIEVYAYSITDQKDEYNKAFREGATVFRDITKLSHAASAKLINEDQIHILIDLAGYTTYCRPQIMALKPAPIQVAFMGYPDTTGADYMDYILADKWLIPESLGKYYKEEVVHLPNAFLSSPFAISEKKFTKAELGLPENSFVYCCFNSIFKISPAVFELWMRILKNAPDGVLWLTNENKESVENIRNEAQRAGVDPSRIVFAQRLPQDEYLASYQCADIFLDTLFYSAGSTAICALYAGLPVLTMAGNTNASRMGASITASAGCEELICNSREEYVEKALSYYSDRSKLTALKNEFLNNKNQSPLFNLTSSVKNLEDQLALIWDKHQINA